MADVRIRYGWAWIALFALMVPGMVLMSSSDPTRVTIGIWLMVTPAMLATLGMLLFYLLARRQAALDEDGSEHEA